MNPSRTYNSRQSTHSALRLGTSFYYYNHGPDIVFRLFSKSRRASYVRVTNASSPAYFIDFLVVAVNQLTRIVSYMYNLVWKKKTKYIHIYTLTIHCIPTYCALYFGYSKLESTDLMVRTVRAAFWEKTTLPLCFQPSLSLFFSLSPFVHAYLVSFLFWVEEKIFIFFLFFFPQRYDDDSSDSLLQDRRTLAHCL